jgi:transposase-like protein
MFIFCSYLVNVVLSRKSHGQHFLLSAAARTLTLAQVFALSDQAAEDLFRAIRWPETQGKPICPHCGCSKIWECPRANGTSRFRCKACRYDFSVTSGTLFTFHKLPLRIYLAAMLIFVNEVKGKAALALCRDLGVQYKTAFVLAHKLREAMTTEVRSATIGGPGTVAEVDGCYVGGHVRPENMKADRKDRRLAENQNGKRRCVVAIRERDGRTIAKTFASEDASIAFIKKRLARGGELHADESPAWSALHAIYPTKRVNHQEGYSFDGACTKWGGIFLLPAAARGNRDLSPYRWRLCRSLRPGVGLP